jgi:hypothetical protein
MTNSDPKKDEMHIEMIMALDLGGDPFAGLPFLRGDDVQTPDGKTFPSWTGTVARPFVTENADGSVTFNRPAADAGEEQLYQRILARNFLELYRGNSAYHYTYNSDTTEYLRVDRPMTLDDVVRHLRGIQPGLLGVPLEPIDGKFVSFFGVIDADRHKESDVSINHAELARLVTMYDLPLIVCHSKGAKSAHLPVFWKEENGFSCELTVQVLKKWTRVLDITGEVDYFPAQVEVKPDQFANGVNLPFFGNERTALGRDGETLSLPEFLVLAHQQRKFGLVYAQRDLGDGPSEPSAVGPKDRKYGPMTIDTARSMHAKNVEELRTCTVERNKMLNNVAFFAAMAYAAKALEGTETSIKNEMLKAAVASGLTKNESKATAKSGWGSGITQPLTIIEIASSALINRPDMPESVLDGYLGKLCRERLPEFPIAYSWPSILTAAGVMVKPHPKNRVSLYTCLVGAIHSGKSQAQERAHFLFRLKEQLLLEELKSGSAEGLLEKIGDKNGMPVLWWPDELSHLLAKAQIEHSAFPFVLNSCYYLDANTLTVAARKKITFNARLTLEGGVVEDNFGDSFGAATVSGLYDRFLFSICPSDFKYSYRPMIGEPLFKTKRGSGILDDVIDEHGELLTITTPAIHSDVWEARDAIQASEGIESRVLEICIRCALICAAWDRKVVLRAVDLGPCWELARYQTRVRALLQPNPGRNFDAIVAYKIKNFLKDQADGDKWITWRDVYRSTHIMEYGPTTCERAVSAMVFAGEIERITVGRQKKAVLRLAVEE